MSPNLFNCYVNLGRQLSTVWRLFIMEFSVLFSCVLVSLTELMVCTGFSVEKRSKTLGYPPKEFDTMVKKAQKIHKLETQITGIQISEKEMTIPKIEDILLTPKLRDDLITELHKEIKKEEPDHHRARRTAFNEFESDPYRKKWNTNTFYYSTNNITKRGQKVLKVAVKTLAQFTCIKLKKTKDSEKADLVFTHEEDMGCASYVGNQTDFVKPQFIYLEEPFCFNTYGTPLHEVLHFLGSWHEHSHEERDDYISVEEGALQSVITKRNTKSNGLPYDFGSVMHYSSYQGRGITTDDSKYQSTIGQRQEMSFYDAKIINLNYCELCDDSDSCGNQGYKIEPNCDECICPDGLQGEHCDEPASNSKGCKPDTGTQIVETGKEECLTSPGFSKGYSPGSQCTWLVKAKDPKCKLKFWFEDRFDIPCSGSGVCTNWVEVRLDGIARQGQRFCCYRGSNLPTFQGQKYGQTRFDTALVNFRTFLDVDKMTKKFKIPGFKLCYTTDEC